MLNPCWQRIYLTQQNLLLPNSKLFLEIRYVVGTGHSVSGKRCVIQSAKSLNWLPNRSWVKIYYFFYKNAREYCLFEEEVRTTLRQNPQNRRAVVALKALDGNRYLVFVELAFLFTGRGGDFGCNEMFSFECKVVKNNIFFLKF